MKQGEFKNNAARKTLSATDLANAWYIGERVHSNVINVKSLMTSLKQKGLSRIERREVVRNAL